MDEQVLPQRGGDEYPHPPIAKLFGKYGEIRELRAGRQPTGELQRGNCHAEFLPVRDSTLSAAPLVATWQSSRDSGVHHDAQGDLVTERHTSPPWRSSRTIFVADSPMSPIISGRKQATRPSGWGKLRDEYGVAIRIGADPGLA
jgi:hypothetical protein